MKNLFVLISVLVFLSCGQREPLPVISRAEVVDGEKVYEKIRDFSFTNQDSVEVTNKTFEGKVYIANYFFTTCPSICPPVSREMTRIYDHFENDDRVGMLSHTMDTKYDTIPVLKRYAEGLEVEAPKWNFVTGDDKEIFDIAYDYKTSALKDKQAPGGFDHDDLLLLVDKDRLIRAYAHGTDPKDVDRFIKDIEFLLKSEY